MDADAAEPRSVPLADQPGRTDRQPLLEDTREQNGLADGQVAAKAPGALHVRCPHCHGSVARSEGDSLSDVTCPACGSHFSLVGGEETLTYPGSGPRTIAGFQLIEQVGLGRYGAVYKARDLQLDRIVAVKIPRRSHLDPAETEQFLREARAAAQVRHPNVVSVHEIGREGDTIYIVSDYVEGVTLTEFLTARRFTPIEAAQFCMKLAQALHAAHEMGVVHRDLKPGNIMIGAGDEPYITDFGLAKRETGEVTMTLEGQILGTPAYMSPEQARGEGHRADRRSDIYSLGVILYELLTGERPFRGDPRMLVLQVLRDEAPSPARLNSRIPRDLESICLKCLEKDSLRRYQTARDLSDDLQRFLAGQPVVARPVGPLGRAWRWYRRHPEAATWTAGGFAVCCAVLLLLWNVTGIVVLSVGFHRSENAGAAIALLGALGIGFFLPILCAGLQTLHGRLVGLWAGVLLAMLGVVLSILGLGHGVFDEAIWGDPVTRLPLFTLLIVVSLVGLVLHIVALVSRKAAESTWWLEDLGRWQPRKPR